MNSCLLQSKIFEIRLYAVFICWEASSCSGKTSLLNALIREYYDLKETDNFPENNIMYINNLKEQGIQYFRNDMKTFCQSHSIIHNKKKDGNN